MDKRVKNHTMSSHSLFDILPDTSLSLIMRKVIMMNQQSARNFVTCCKKAWYSDALVQHVSRLDIPEEEAGWTIIRDRIRSFPVHATLRTLTIRTCSSQLLQGLRSLFDDDIMSTKVARLETLQIEAVGIPKTLPFALSDLQKMLAKLPRLTTLRLPCLIDTTILSHPVSAALRTLDLDIYAIRPPADLHSFCDFNCKSFPNLKDLGVAIARNVRVPAKGLRTLLTSSCMRRLSVCAIEADEDIDPLLLSSSPLTSLCFGEGGAVMDPPSTSEFLMPLLRHLPQLDRVGIIGYKIDVHLCHEAHASSRLAQLAPYASADGKLFLFVVSDEPDNPFGDLGDRVYDIVHMDKREVVERLRNCLHPLRGSRFGESITELGFDPTLLPPSAMKVVADVFPCVVSSMSLCEAASAWPRLSAIKVGSITSSTDDPPTFEQMKTALLPVMMVAQARQRPLKLTHASVENILVQETAIEEWMMLHEEWQHLMSTSGMGSFVDMIPA